MSKGLRVSLVGMGLFFICLGIFMNFQLYSSLGGDSTLYKTSYELIGVGLDVSKILCLSLGVFLIGLGTTSTIIVGIVSLAFWLVLSCISLSAGWGFSLIVAQQYENKGMQNSVQLKSAQASVESAQARLDSASQYASVDIAALTTRKESLENALTTLDNALNKCPEGWIQKCINPTMAKIETVNSELEQIATQLSGHQSYLSALTYKENAVKQLANLDVSQLNTNSYIHPLFLGLAEIFDTDAEIAKYRLLLVTFIAIEWLGTLFFAIGVLFDSKREFTLADLEALEKKRDDLKRVYGYQINSGSELITQQTEEWQGMLGEQGSNKQGMLGEQGSNKQGMLREQGSNKQGTHEEQKGMLGEQGTSEERKQWTVKELVDHITNKYTKTTWTVRELASTFYIGNSKAQEVRSLLIQTQKTGENR